MAAGSGLRARFRCFWRVSAARDMGLVVGKRKNFNSTSVTTLRATEGSGNFSHLDGDLDEISAAKVRQIIRIFHCKGQVPERGTSRSFWLSLEGGTPKEIRL